MKLGGLWSFSAIVKTWHIFPCRTSIANIAKNEKRGYGNKTPWLEINNKTLPRRAMNSPCLREHRSPTPAAIRPSSETSWLHQRLQKRSKLMPHQRSKTSRCSSQCVRDHLQHIYPEACPWRGSVYWTCHTRRWPSWGKATTRDRRVQLMMGRNITE